MPPTCETRPILVRTEMLPGRFAIESAAPVVRDALARMARARTGDRSLRRLVRVVLPIEPLDALDWLSGQRETPRVYWQSRDGQDEVAALGALASWDATDFSPLDAMLAGDERAPSLCPPARLALTARFQPSPAGDSSWRAFGRVRAWLPRVEVRRARTSYYFSFAMSPEEPDLVDRLLFGLPAPIAAPTDGLDLAAPEADEAARQAFTGAVAQALERIARGPLEKVVLAHRFERVLRRAPSPIALLRALRDLHPEAYVFGILPNADEAFLGASPELLYRRRARDIESEALAGTRPRGQTLDEDDALARALDTSEKERDEHRYVVEHICRELGPLCETLATSPRHVRRFSNVQHLRTGVSGVLRPAVTDAELLTRLHPTPAVCGYPSSDARALIAQLEGFDRGLYGGVVGWVGEAETECAVAIRSARVRGSEIVRYVGAGIVPGSTAEEEWDEITSKLGAFDGLLTSHAT